MNAAVTELIIEVFRLNGGLLAAGDQLVKDNGLTSSRWQVLGAIDMSAHPLPVAQIARKMGLSRQAVQRLCNALSADGLVEFADNPQHVRAKLVIMSEAGKRAFAAAMALQGPWAAGLVDGISAPDVETTIKVLRSLREKLEINAELGED